MAPEDSKRTVLTRGNSHGSMGCIPAGGQLQPSSTVGAKALSKKAQKIERKKKTSDTIKRIIPIMRPRWTRKVWCPKNVKNPRYFYNGWTIS